MSIDQILVLGIVLIISLFFFVAFMGYLVPVYQKVEFDSICREYTLLIEAQNGLETDQVNKLNQKLSNKGLDVENISCNMPERVKKGSIMTFTVNAKLKQNEVVSLFTREERIYDFHYTQEVVAVKVTN